MRAMFETVRSMLRNQRQGGGPCDPFAIGPWDIASDFRREVGDIEPTAERTAWPGAGRRAEEEHRRA